MGDLVDLFVLFACDLAGTCNRTAFRFGQAGLAGQLQNLILCNTLARRATVRVRIVASELLLRLAFGADKLAVLGVPVKVGA